LETTLDPDGAMTGPYREVMQPIYHEQMGSQKHNRRKTIVLDHEAFERIPAQQGRPDKRELYTQEADNRWRKNDSDEILDAGFDWKGAGTDCLKKCATLFGIALELSRKGASRPHTGRPTTTQRPQQPQNAPSRPSQGSNGAGAPPSGGRGFKPPFGFQKVAEKLACEAAQCGVVLVPGEVYEIIEGDTVLASQKTEYIVKRSKEEAFNHVLCLKHIMDWIAAKREQGVPLVVDPVKAAGA
jgi:hypothetical protein